MAIVSLWMVSQVSPAQQLLSNGDFSLGLDDWTVEVSTWGGLRTVTIVPYDPPYSQVVEVASYAAQGYGSSSQAQHDLLVPVSEYREIYLSADVKAISASVGAGCGWNGLEYPIALFLNFDDPQGINRNLIFAFYYGGGTCGHPDEAWGPTAVWATPTWVPQDQWYHFDSPDLKGWIANGSIIRRLTVLGNGWAYVGRADNVTLLGVPLDATPPEVLGMPSNCSLWPPNKRMVLVATVTAIDAGSGLDSSSFEVSGSSNQPQNPDDPDVVVTQTAAGAFTVHLRADRLGADSDRVYTLTATATDIAGNTATETATCVVPHDRRK
jgi:hypothetical protein